MQGDLTRSHTMLLLCPMSMLCGLEKLLLMLDHVMSLLEAVGYNVSLSQCRTWINPFIARGGAADKERVKVP